MACRRPTTYVEASVNEPREPERRPKRPERWWRRVDPTLVAKVAELIMKIIDFISRNG